MSATRPARTAAQPPRRITGVAAQNEARGRACVAKSIVGEPAGSWGPLWGF